MPPTGQHRNQSRRPLPRALVNSGLRIWSAVHRPWTHHATPRAVEGARGARRAITRGAPIDFPAGLTSVVSSGGEIVAWKTGEMMWLPGLLLQLGEREGIAVITIESLIVYPPGPARRLLALAPIPETSRVIFEVERRLSPPGAFRRGRDRFDRGRPPRCHQRHSQNGAP
jgi:hypothetical protein